MVERPLGGTRESVTYKKCILLSVVLVVTLTSACESDAAKYDRLNKELILAQAPVDNYAWAEAHHEPLCPDLSRLPTNAYLDACTKRIEDDQRKLALAQREMNRFMRR
jgi:hypothetical protein